MGEFGDYFKTWNWETGFRYSRNEGQNLSIGDVSQPGLRQALFDTDPAMAFNPFLGFLGQNSKAARSGVYVTLQNTGEFELPLGYVTINGDLFNLPAGPVSFAIGGEYRGERMTLNRDSLNQTFNSIGSADGQGYRANRDVWSIYEEVTGPLYQPYMELTRVLQLRDGLRRAGGMVQPEHFDSSNSIPTGDQLPV